MAANGVATPDTMTAQQLCRVIVKSRLVEESTLNRSLMSVRVKHDGHLPEDAKTLADDLVASGLITDWQATHLLEGRTKGYHLGKYKLFRLLGAGGMGAVYLAEHTVMNKRVAIKVLPRESAQKSNSVESFQAEARTAAMLDHPNVVRTIDIDEVKERHFIVMEHVDGSDLDHRVRKAGPLPVAETLGFFRQAALGLQYAHERGVLHRDVKPQNMLITRDGVLKISDLGLARIRHQAVDTEKRRIVGTADYIAPEQAQNSQTVDGRADLYSLGCTLYFMLTGRPPFADGNAMQRIAAHQLAPPPDLAEKRPDCPADLVAIYQRLMQKQPEDRYQTATELLAAVDRLSPVAMAPAGMSAPPAVPTSGSSFSLPAGGSAGRTVVGDTMFDTSASGTLGSGLGGSGLASGGLDSDGWGSGGDLGEGVDLGALATGAPAAGSVTLKPREEPADPEATRQKVLLYVGIGLAVVALILPIAFALSSPSNDNKPSFIKSTEGDSNVIIIDSAR